MRANEIETSRLIMRPHTPLDFAACAAMWAEPEVVHHISGKPSTREESWSRLLRYAGHWATMGFGYWAVRETATGQFIGDVGLSEFRRDIVPSIEGVAEAGWVLVPAAHGKGYATEAVQAALAWYEGAFDARRTVCMIAPENFASLRVAEKCAYREFIRTQHRGDPVVLLERHRARD